ncbi:hypothetical protein H4R34_000746 [Dimargaris verticillata]|uniref:S-adenosyl-L-methionine-dependent methyltransferase n=1 Tax=Dimargaris verticillata TaxID=2761393 RepID=A0A9W8BCP2_9FUNG|nr:hypothetical protein H4R34_000746 [Dimargaris verticillata]
MKLNALEGYLQEVRVFDNPKVHYEQYPTSAHLAARIVYTAANSYDDIEDKLVADLGCGCGMLGIAAFLMGAGHVTGLDIDADALGIAQANISKFEVPMDLVRSDITHPNPVDQDATASLIANEALLRRLSKTVDTVVMNPPFGTKPGNKGIDMAFLRAALTLATTAVYSLHKSSTRDYIRAKAKSWGATGQVLAELRFDVPQMYKFHKKKSVDIQVDLWRFQQDSC